MPNTVIHRIKVKDLNADFIKKIQAKHRSDDAEIVFHMNLYCMLQKKLIKEKQGKK